MIKYEHNTTHSTFGLQDGSQALQYTVHDFLDGESDKRGGMDQIPNVLALTATRLQLQRFSFNRKQSITTAEMDHLLSELLFANLVAQAICLTAYSRTSRPVYHVSQESEQYMKS